MPKFVNVSFMFPGVPKVRDLEPTIASVCNDWIRYSVTSWILWTDVRADHIFQAIEPKIDAQDQVLIAPIDADYSFGRLSPWIWMWMNSKRPETGIVFGDDLRATLKRRE